VLAIFSQAPGVNKNAVNVDYYKLVEVLPEHFMHKILEYTVDTALIRPNCMMQYSLWPVAVFYLSPSHIQMGL